MNVIIWDLDWYYKTSIMPNVKCMKLSSYHKQKGDTVNFVTEKFHISLQHDICYIIKEQDNTPMPSKSILDSNTTKLLGDGFKYYNRKELSEIIVACRPDYLLYEVNENNSFTNANIVNFYAGKTLVKQQQDWHNTKRFHKKTLVVDKYFWKATDEEIIYCLNVLKNEKNIAFLEPISLKKILTNDLIKEKFLQLNFTKGSQFKWKNDYSSKYEDCQKIINFLIELKKNTSSNIGLVPFKSITLDHIENSYNFDLDAMRCFKIIALFKKNKIKCKFLIPTSARTQHKNFIQHLTNWTQNYFELSFIEYILHFDCMKQGIEWDKILKDIVKWNRQSIDMLLYMLTDSKWQDCVDLLCLQWGEEVLNKNKIDFEYIKKQLNILYKE